jgi:hypothetical protein
MNSNTITTHFERVSSGSFIIFLLPPMILFADYRRFPDELDFPMIAATIFSST